MYVGKKLSSDDFQLTNPTVVGVFLSNIYQRLCAVRKQQISAVKVSPGLGAEHIKLVPVLSAGTKPLCSFQQEVLVDVHFWFGFQ